LDTVIEADMSQAWACGMTLGNELLVIDIDSTICEVSAGTWCPMALETGLPPFLMSQRFVVSKACVAKPDHVAAGSFHARNW
jgi:hypothetical protein